MANRLGGNSIKVLETAIRKSATHPVAGGLKTARTLSALQPNPSLDVGTPFLSSGASAAPYKYLIPSLNIAKHLGPFFQTTAEADTVFRLLTRLQSVPIVAALQSVRRILARVLESGGEKLFSEITLGS
jgi:hypothetical protein